MEVSRPPLVEPLALRVFPPRGRQHGRSRGTRRHAPGRRHRPFGRDETEECKSLSCEHGRDLVRHGHLVKVRVGIRLGVGVRVRVRVRVRVSARRPPHRRPPTCRLEGSPRPWSAWGAHWRWCYSSSPSAWGVASLAAMARARCSLGARRPPKDSPARRRPRQRRAGRQAGPDARPPSAPSWLGVRG